MTEDRKQYQIVERAEAGDRYLHHFDTRADAEKAKGIYEQWARAQGLKYHYEILDRAPIMGYPCVADPQIPEGTFLCLPEKERDYDDREQLEIEMLRAIARATAGQQILNRASVNLSYTGPEADIIRRLIYKLAEELDWATRRWREAREWLEAEPRTRRVLQTVSRTDTGAYRG